MNYVSYRHKPAAVFMEKLPQRIETGNTVSENGMIVTG